VTARPSLPAYQAPAWLPGGHAQTLYPALFGARPTVHYHRERWETPDGDFIDIDWAEKQDRGSRIEDRETDSAPLTVLFHGLEGSSHSHYAGALMSALGRRGWRGAVVHFRSCSGEPNRLRRAYHSGDSDEIDWVLRRMRDRTPRLYAVGVSLGGNALLKWLGERGGDVTQLVAAAAAISAPVDLMAAGNALDAGFNLIYTRNFLATLKRKTLAKLAHFPDLCERTRMLESRTLRQFDDLVTAPLHGFRDTDDYWTRASSKPWLAHIAVPTLVINARNDPFMPAAALPGKRDVSAAVVLEQPQDGGHVGFLSGPFPGHLEWLPRRVLEFFESHAA
jgi:predicted alpha/beta-fold hydrolase